VNYEGQEQAGMATPAAGGVKAPPQQPQMPPVFADDVPNLTDPTARPGEPLSDGLPVGPGRGPDALRNRDPRNMETMKLKKWLPLLDPYVDDPETPDSVRAFIRYIRSS
jgi:hypothetical protein